MSTIVLAKIISFLHLLLVIFVVAVPFLPNVDWKILAIHVTLTVCLMLHWLMNSDTCALTLLESALLGVDEKQSFMYKLVSPVYKIKDENLSKIVKTLVPILTVISAYKLHKVFPEAQRELQMLFNSNKSLQQGNQRFHTWEDPLISHNEIM